MIQAPAGLALTPNLPPALFSLSPPPPPPPATFAAGIISTPSRSIGSPYTRFTVSASRAPVSISSTFIGLLLLWLRSPV
jgi:hypothetical protein